MTPRHYLFLFLLSLGVGLVVAFFQHAPGYMDADYYFAAGYRLATGYGLTEAILWNYLDDPAGLPHPSHGYWMPLVSLLAAPGIWLAGGEAAVPLDRFPAARSAFLLIAALIPPLTARLAFTLTQDRSKAWLSGLLACFPGYYLPNLVTADAFGIYMLLGVLWLQVAGGSWQVEGCRLKVRTSTFNLPTLRQAFATQNAAQGRLFDPSTSSGQALQPFFLGLLAGLMHLTRADGLLWLALALVAVALPNFIRNPQSAIRNTQHATRNTQHAIRNTQYAIRITFHVSRLALCLLGYLLVMGPWMARNLAVFGTPLSPGGGSALWLLEYNELFSYPSAMLTFGRWQQAGLLAALEARRWAGWLNLQNAFAAQGQIFLAPLILLAAWRLRNDHRVHLGALAWLLTFAVMTLIFPFPGARGGFYHSGAALQPLLWALAPVGLDVFVAWGQRVRGWTPHLAMTVFRAGLVGLAALMSALVIPLKMVGTEYDHPAWSHSLVVYTAVEAALLESGAQPADRVLVNNPPGYFIVTGREAIVIPNGDLSTLLAVARRYGIRYVVLEGGLPQGLLDLYTRPGDRPGLEYLSMVEDAHLYQVSLP